MQSRRVISRKGRPGWRFGTVIGSKIGRTGTANCAGILRIWRPAGIRAERIVKEASRRNGTNVKRNAGKKTSRDGKNEIAIYGTIKLGKEETFRTWTRNGEKGKIRRRKRIKIESKRTWKDR